MENLKLIENEKIPVYETTTGEKVVYGSDLHKGLCVRSNYREWSQRRFKDCDASETLDYQAIYIQIPNNPCCKIDHIISIPLALEMSVLERNQKGKEIRKILCNHIRIANQMDNYIEFDSSFKSIYIMQSNGFYKIGTSCDPINRLNQFKTSNLSMELVYYTIPVTNPFEIETNIHNKLKQLGYHVEREWFDIDDLNIVIDIINEEIKHNGKFYCE